MGLFIYLTAMTAAWVVPWLWAGPPGKAGVRQKPNQTEIE